MAFARTPGTQTPVVTIVSMRFGRRRRRVPPLAALMLKRHLDDRSLPTEVLDAQDAVASCFAVDEAAALLAGIRTPVLGLSVCAEAVPLVIAALDARGITPGQRVVVGGPGVTGIASGILARLPAVDSVVVGEGEGALAQIAAGEDVASTPGLFTRGQASAPVHAHPEAPRFCGAAAWDWCRGKDYATIPIQTGRGCPRACAYCSVPASMRGRPRFRAVPEVLDDLQHALETTGASRVAVLDDAFTERRDRVLEFCEGIRERGLDVRFSVYARPDQVDGRLARALGAAGCDGIFVGLDAGDNTLLRRLGKNVDAGSGENTVRECAEHVRVTASLIWGFPFEDLRAFRRTVELADRLAGTQAAHPILPQLHLLAPMPATPLLEAHGDELVLDLDAELLVLSGSLRENGFRSGHARVLEVVRTDRGLCAPFHRYATPGWSEKSRSALRFGREMQARAGREILRSWGGARPREIFDDPVG